jgi:hypothetical protein
MVPSQGASHSRGEGLEYELFHDMLSQEPVPAPLVCHSETITPSPDMGPLSIGGFGHQYAAYPPATPTTTPALHRFRATTPLAVKPQAYIGQIANQYAAYPRKTPFVPDAVQQRQGTTAPPVMPPGIGGGFGEQHAAQQCAQPSIQQRALPATYPAGYNPQPTIVPTETNRFVFGIRYPHNQYVDVNVAQGPSLSYPNATPPTPPPPPQQQNKYLNGPFPTPSIADNVKRLAAIQDASVAAAQCAPSSSKAAKTELLTGMKRRPASGQPTAQGPAEQVRASAWQSNLFHREARAAQDEHNRLRNAGPTPPGVRHAPPSPGRGPMKQDELRCVEGLNDVRRDQLEFDDRAVNRDRKKRLRKARLDQVAAFDRQICKSRAQKEDEISRLKQVVARVQKGTSLPEQLDADLSDGDDTDDSH